MAQTNDGILYAIRFRETGEEKVARQLARLDQALNLLRGGTAKGYYNSSVFSKRWKDRQWNQATEVPMMWNTLN